MFSSLPDPPSWLVGWVQFFVVQIVGLITIAFTVWKWLTKPIKEGQKRNSRRLSLLRKAFKHDSFEIRNSFAINSREIMETNRKIEMIEHKLDTLIQATSKQEKTMIEIRDRLTSVETELKVRHEDKRRRRDDV